MRPILHANQRAHSRVRRSRRFTYSPKSHPRNMSVRATKKLDDAAWKVKRAIMSGFDTTAFPRDLNSTGVPAMSSDRALCIALNLAIPVASYYLSTGGHYQAVLASAGVATYALSSARQYMLRALDVFYGLRWATQDFVQLSGKGGFAAALKVASFHHVLHTAFTWMSFYAAPALPVTLTAREVAGAGVMVLGGALQCVSETQRYLFKRDKANAGKLHTGGLFGVARFINTTGHVLRDAGAVICTGNAWLAGLFVVPDYLLMSSICATETVAYMRLKYKERYTAYEKKTPALFVPGLW
jgi:hypothetical protein